jgi:AraC-like DNA-binding protein
MSPDFPRGRSSTSFKHFFSPRPLDTPKLSIAGIGLHEKMPPVYIRRPQGTGDYLIMLFHDEACAACDASMGNPHPPETMMIWRPGMAQYYGHGSQPYSHSWIHCQGTRIRHWLKETGLPQGTAFPVFGSAQFSHCLLSLYNELVSHVRPNAVIASNLLENGLHEIARGPGDGKSGDAVPEGLLAVRRWIGTAPARKVTLDELAQIAGMSVPYFCARFKKAFGQPPIASLIAQRLDHAAYLLADRNLNISTIAAQAGYEDAFHFSKAFKRQFGKSPRDWRRERHGG